MDYSLVLLIVSGFVGVRTQNTPAGNPLGLNNDHLKLFHDHIGREYQAFYQYEQIANTLEHPTIARRGFAKFFRKQANEEIEHARKLVTFVNRRLGINKYKNLMAQIDEPTMKKIESPIEAVGYAIELENSVTESLQALSNKAAELNDSQAGDMLDSFLEEQMKSVAELTTLESRLQQNQLATFLIDQEFMQEKYSYND